MENTVPILRLAEKVKEVEACFELVRLLRPHLADPHEFVSRWQRQRTQNYHLLVAWENRKPLALAGFRYQENLLHGPHLYVDDLVTSHDARGKGYGGLLLDRLKVEAKSGISARWFWMRLSAMRSATAFTSGTASLHEVYTFGPI